MSRIYVCHTFYHVYVSIFKRDEAGGEDTVYEKGDIALSSISTDLEIWKRDCARLVFSSELWHLMRKREEFFPSLPSIVRITATFSNIW